jgi:hypothetical protein
MNRFPRSCCAAIGGAWAGGGLADLLAVPSEYRGLVVLPGLIAVGLYGSSDFVKTYRCWRSKKSKT